MKFKNNFFPNIFESVFNSELSLDDPERPIENVVGKIEGCIHIFTVSSIVILIGLFINFVSDICVIFSNINNVGMYANFYFLSNVATIFLFFFLIKKYVYFFSSWASMQCKYSNNRDNSGKLIDLAGNLISIYCRDFCRYILLIFFIFLILNKRSLLIMSDSTVNLELFLVPSGLLLFFLLCFIVEWPTIILWQLYKHYFVNDLNSEQSMSFE